MYTPAVIGTAEGGEPAPFHEGHMVTITTPFGPVDLLDGESPSTLSITPAVPVLPSTLPDPVGEVVRLTRATSPADVGRHGPPVGALSTSDGANDGRHFRLFEVVFGRDSQIIARNLDPTFPGILLTTVRYLAEQQGLPRSIAPQPELYTRRDEQPGRIPHEVRDPATDARARQLSERDGWAWPFYRSDDATLYFIRNVADLARADPPALDIPVRQRDGVVRTLGDCLVAALGFAASLTRNPEGLVESVRPPRFRADGGLPAYPVWQDSGDAPVRDDGSIATGPIAWAELQAAYFDALMATSRLARQVPGVADHLGLDADTLQRQASALRMATVRALWVDEQCRDGGRGYFAYGAERLPDGRLVPLRVLKSNPGHLLESEILEDADLRPYVARLVRTLMDPRNGLICPSGVRSLGRYEPRFRPGGYHNGLVWLWENHVFARGLDRHGYHQLGLWLDRTVRRVCDTVHHYPEHVRGDDSATPQENRAVVTVSSYAPGIGAWTNTIQQPGQLVQGWTLSAYIDAGRHLAEAAMVPFVVRVRGLVAVVVAAATALVDGATVPALVDRRLYRQIEMMTAQSVSGHGPLAA